MDEPLRIVIRPSAACWAQTFTMNALVPAGQSVASSHTKTGLPAAAGAMTKRSASHVDGSGKNGVGVTNSGA